jgi:hypothetical protein
VPSVDNNKCCCCSELVEDGEGPRGVHHDSCRVHHPPHRSAGSDHFRETSMVGTTRDGHCKEEEEELDCGGKSVPNSKDLEAGDDDAGQ